MADEHPCRKGPKAAGVQCPLHDLRHTAATKMAEAGVPDSTMLGLVGHMSGAMLERYSHIRMGAKRLLTDTAISDSRQIASRLRRQSIALELTWNSAAARPRGGPD